MNVDGRFNGRRSSAAAAAAAQQIVALKPTRPSKRTAVEDVGEAGGAGRPARPAHRPPPQRTAAEKNALLQTKSTLDLDESYGEQETALSEFLKLHPMLSLESSTHSTLQLVSNLVSKVAIPTRELEVVTKSFDDASLRPANTELGERPCCLGDRCVALWLARWRLGEDSALPFTCTEFLLPSVRNQFVKDGPSALPKTPGKCLVCTRYFHTYVYRLARNDPTFDPSAEIGLQCYQNPLGTTSGESVITHTSVVNDNDGYRPEAMLFVDEGFADTSAARTSMSSLLWRPCVKFAASHYDFVLGEDGKPRILQVNVGSDPNFRQPASLSRAKLAKKA